MGSFVEMGYYDTYLLQNFEAKIREAEEIVYSLQNLSYDLTESKIETPFVSAFANYSSNKKSEKSAKSKPKKKERSELLHEANSAITVLDELIRSAKKRKNQLKNDHRNPVPSGVGSESVFSDSASSGTASNGLSSSPLSEISEENRPTSPLLDAAKNVTEALGSLLGQAKTQRESAADLSSPSASSKELSYRVSRRVRDKADIPDKVEKARQDVHSEIKQKESWIRRKGLAVRTFLGQSAIAKKITDSFILEILVIIIVFAVFYAINPCRFFTVFIKY